MLVGDIDVDESTDSLQIPVQVGVSSTNKSTDTAFDDDFSLSALMGMRSIVEKTTCWIYHQLWNGLRQAKHLW